MPSKARGARQAKRERNAIRKLISTGLYTGKVDLRKVTSHQTPTPYQRKLIAKYANVIAGKATVLRPADPKSYGKIFEVKGDAVIIPVRKGETFRVDAKTGRIKGRRRTRRGTIKQEFIPIKPGASIKRSKEPTQYAIPFNRGDHLEWQRHPSFDALKSFMTEYAKYKGWKKYTVGERDPVLLENEMDFEDDEDLTFVLEEKLGPQYGASAGRFRDRPKRKPRKPRTSPGKPSSKKKVRRKRKARR